ncbi:enoyl-CoA hydratase/isomerase family protein [Saccharospirillum salsuginis]|uniref:Enoyl-CoA hydratase n=1 Tax=Saccharospirillum salsuginis TaxID=418750 RepID=A0A918KM66_9GAMM|nr:enoyl-CoA hydratase-related protein [Saccharospirillum salsuginis]GGX68647.1 enoyl-CoA hydratase [Saccharospirillum salsuginis]
MSSMLITEAGEGLFHARLNRPEAHNALNTALLQALSEAFARADDDPSIRVILISGTGEHFAAGADINEIADKTEAEGADDVRKTYWRQLQSVRKPVIAAVEGYCLGGGCELALSADLCVAADDASFGQPEIRLGLIPGAGGLQRLADRLGKARAMRLALLGERISGATAYDWGLVSHRADRGEAVTTARSLAEKLVKAAPLAVEASKAAVLKATEDRLNDGLDWERRAFERLLSSQDKIEGITAFREKRRPTFTGQ